MVMECQLALHTPQVSANAVCEHVLVMENCMLIQCFCPALLLIPLVMQCADGRQTGRQH